MIRLLADQNFNGKALRAIRRELPDADIVRVQDTAMYQAPDPEVLEWAATQDRILLSHDIETMIGYANERLAAGLPMPGLIIANKDVAVSQIVSNLLTIIGASEMSDWENRIIYLP